MSAISLPNIETPGRRLPWRLMMIGPVLALGIAGYVFRDSIFPGGGGGSAAGTYQIVTPAELQVRLVRDGEIQAVNNIEVVNHVEGINTIVELVKEGTFVKKGDKLVVLDSVNIQEKYDTSVLELQNAVAALSSAKEAKEIQEATNKANLQAAELDMEVARIELDEYLEGLAKQSQNEAATKVRMAEIMVKNKEEDLATTRNLFAKGFVTAADVKKAELELLTCQNDYRKAETDLRVLTDYTHKKNLATRKSAVAQAEQKLERTKKENNASLNKCEAAFRQAEQAKELRKELTDKLKEQLRLCTIVAPADGMVVYASSSDRSGADPIKEGGSVRNMQVLCRLPDTSAMKAVIRVQEGQVGRLRVDEINPMRATVEVTGYRRPIGATISRISVLADSSQRFWNPDIREYPVELVLDETPTGLKPGLGCKVDILMEHRGKALSVPLPALYSAGPHAFVFVKDAAGGEAKAAEVKLGVSNETQAEVLSGIEPGAEVLLLQPGQGRQLLEKSGIKVQPTTRPSDGKRGKKGGVRAEVPAAAAVVGKAKS
ncbi:MAG TPA: HlyD family efflux transporter periplasmic adaptor subunit [Tepidisphaeraceae bacterium]|nr:HlyD family efflux transporter periplasmic adaptor subunit [Tepidisphaeraceae bacterium]